MPKLLLIDGNSIMNRAFYGVPDLTNVNGLHTNAVYGFLNIMFRFIDEEHPDYMAVAFDLHAPTFRHKMYEAYKGTRKGMPDELREQVPYVKKIVNLLNIPIVELEGYEADDLLGTLAKKGQSDGFDVTLVSGDRDLLQIADSHIKIRIPKTVRGQTTIEDYYPEDVIKAYEVTPEEFIHMKALMGDSSDNIPGVPKVGAKTAQELIVTYHNLDNIYSNLDNISKASIKTSLEENKELAYLCLKLATIEINAPLNKEPKELNFEPTFTTDGLALIKELGLKSYYKKFEDNLTEKPLVEENVDFDTVFDFAAFISFPSVIKNSSVVAYVKGDYGSAFYADDKYYFVPLMFDTKDVLNCVLNGFNGVFITSDSEMFFSNFDKKELRKNSSLITDRLFFVDLAAYLVNPLNNDYSISALADMYFHLNVSAKPVSEEDLVKNVNAVFKLYNFLKKELEDSNQYDLFKNIEMPLSLVLYEMQRTGILVNPDGLKEYSANLEASIVKLEKEIYEEAGHEFNILSPKQLGVILFEEMGIKGGKKTKTGYSTSADVLEKLSGEYPFVDKILEYRGLTKLKSTYADGLFEAIGEDKRIHSKFLQTVTATGRISSAEPNLQNIPIRTELGRELRKVFIPKEGCFFADADYSQIELRVLASLSKDPVLIDSFISGKDIHAVTASRVFDVPLEKVSSNQRRMAKVVNFGIIYGMSSFSLGQDLNISKKDADKYIEEYFNQYPSIKAYLDSCVSDAVTNGYSLTSLLRRRPIPELKASMFMQKEFGKRVAMNAPIQGTAADIMKLAMIKVRDALVNNNLKSEILIQVHDELLLEVDKDEKDQVLKILLDNMQNAYSLAVPLTAELETGDNWYEAK